MPTYKKQETKRGRDKPWSGLDVHARISLPSLQHDPTAVKGDRTHECEETNSKAELQGTIANNKTQAQKEKKIQNFIPTYPRVLQPRIPFFLAGMYTHLTRTRTRTKKSEKKNTLALTRVSTLAHRIITAFLVESCFVSFRRRFPVPLILHSYTSPHATAEAAGFRKPTAKGS